MKTCGLQPGICPTCDGPEGEGAQGRHPDLTPSASSLLPVLLLDQTQVGAKGHENPWCRPHTSLSRAEKEGRGTNHQHLGRARVPLLPCANPWGTVLLTLLLIVHPQQTRCRVRATAPEGVAELGALPQPSAEGPALSVSRWGACTVREPEDDHFLLLTVLNEWNKSGQLQEQKLRLKNSFTNN